MVKFHRILLSRPFFFKKKKLKKKEIIFERKSEKGENRPTHVTDCGLVLHTCNDGCPAAAATVLPLNFPRFFVCCFIPTRPRSQSTRLSAVLIAELFGGVQRNIIKIFFLKNSRCGGYLRKIFRVDKTITSRRPDHAAHLHTATAAAAAVRRQRCSGSELKLNR